MRILHVNEKFGPYGGTEQYLLKVLPALKLLGHEVALAYQSALDLAPPAKDFPAFQINGLSDFALSEIPQIESSIEKAVNDFNPNIINLHNLRNPFAIKKFISLRPTIWFCHDHYFSCLKTPPSRFSKVFNRAENFPANWQCALAAVLDQEIPPNPIEIYRKVQNKRFEQKSFKGVKKIVVISEYMKKSLIDCDFDSSLIEVVPRPVRDLPRVVSFKPKGHNILFVGRVEQEKGIRILLKSMLRLQTKEWQLKVVGAGQDLEWCQEFVREKSLGDRVELAGAKGDKEVSLFMEWSDLLAFPSIWPEPFGVVGIEAMAYGRPVIAFNVGGVEEWLKDGINGLFACYNNPQDLGRQIDLLLNDKEKMKAFGGNGRKMVEERFTLRKHLEKLMGVYQEILNF